MPTTVRRASAPFLVLPLLASLTLVGPSTPAGAAPLGNPEPGLSAGFYGERLDIGDQNAQRAVRAQVRELRREARLEARREAARKAEAARQAAAAASRGSRLMSAAAALAGTPYAYGATGPSAFDCSGYTSWVFRTLGIELPRTSGAQAAATTRVSSPEVGDLVFFSSGGRVYHVGIYAGNNEIWHSPRPGRSVSKERIWSSSVFYGRVG